MKAALATALLLASTTAAMAQMSPVGLWRSVDDKTGEVKAEIRIEEVGNAFAGRIEKTLKKDTKADAVCDECTDDRKGKPILGLEIIRGNKILDPENGKEYRASFTPIADGKKLEVRGYLGPFWRTQVWNRAQ
ncbi:DUF2147 domain-containing protein [Variovorax sp. PAMC 28711]|uniref:DUF2147 domain-containing protein n=1 Tax=Variovorax sp. PAMC 28711 TaxID=1795631 RepID=UPI00078E4AB9|nr:DUF2147 domain-containing protein [Variovorax sp. PAMC 28711]AMM24177.1 hypothetical protein AX767_07310 [Variovorax sp. PAMC 28711]